MRSIASRSSFVSTIAKRLLVPATALLFTGAPLLIHSEWSQFVDKVAALQCRSTRGRIAGIPYRPACNRDRVRLAIRAAARPVVTQCKNSRVITHRCAITSLLTGNATIAASQLSALARHSGDPSLWADLSAAYIELGQKGDSPPEYANALAAADRAIALQPANAVALFNRAIALDDLHIEPAAHHAYDRYLAAEPESDWSSEARSRLIRAPTARAAWKDSLPKVEALAIAHDVAALTKLVRRYPQESRTYAEGVFLGFWADALRKGDRAAADRWLTVARAVASVLQQTSGESLAADQVRVIEHASPLQLPMLVTGHILYWHGREAYHFRKLDDAISNLRESARLFRAAGSPMTLIADYYATNAALDQGHDVLSDSTDLLRRTPARYRALHALLLWLIGTAHGARGGVYESLEAYSQAAKEFDSLREESFAQFMRNAVATCYSALGDDSAAMRERRQVFLATSRAGDLDSLQIEVVTAADEMVHRGEWAAARALYNVAIEVNPASRNADLAARTLVWRAMSGARVPWIDALHEFSIASTAASALTDSNLRSDVMEELSAASAPYASPPERIEKFDRAIAYFARRGQVSFRPELFIGRACALLAVNAGAAAEKDLRTAVDFIELRRATIADDSLRDSYFHSSDAAYTELIDRLERDGRIEEAFDVRERAAGRALLDRSGRKNPRPMTALKGAIADETFLSFVALPERLVVFMLNHRGVTRIATPVARTALRSQIDQLVNALRHGVFEEQTAASLYDKLIRPAFRRDLPRRLVIIPDPTTAHVPFAALWDRRLRRFLVEPTSITSSPSVNVYLRLRDRGERRAGEDRPTLIVADPALARARYGDLPNLPGAAREGREIASMYKRSRLLEYGDSTKTAVIPLLETSSIAHFATHAIVNESQPRLSALLLSDGSLSIADIVALRLDLRLIVLAGCRTSDTTGARGDLQTLANAFVSAGARSVVATLWNLDDVRGRTVTVKFHSAVAAGMPADEALRSAQLFMLHGNDPKARTPAAWANLQILGSGR
jgi:CHAT domain-containing protein/tetratricopeptide (TPR) repeat protein